MTPVKAVNAVVAVTDLLAASTQEYEQRIAAAQKAFEAAASQLKQMQDEQAKAQRVLNELALLSLGTTIEDEVSAVLADWPWPIPNATPSPRPNQNPTG